MNEIARILKSGLERAGEAVQALAPGLKNFGPDVKAELSRLGTQGSMELASAIHKGNAFVPYGPGQYTPSVEYEHEHEHEQQHDHHQQDHGQQHEHEHQLEIER
jgi:hypothetical protein